MINFITVKGNLTQDPEFKEVGERKIPCCNLKLAVNTKERSAMTPEGYKEEVLFITAVCWSKQALMCRDSLRKGSGVTIEGRLKQDRWKDNKTGEEKSAHKIQINVIIIDGKEIMPGDNVGPIPAMPNPVKASPMINQRKQIKNDDEFDELPF